MKLRFANVKSACGKCLNLNPTDARVLDYVNRAMERLLYEGMFVGTKFRYTVCISEKCLVWPREVETILAAWMCNHPLTIRGSFYEALENGPGLASGCGPCLTLIDRGQTVTFDWITTTGYKLAIYADGTEAAGTVLIRYYNDSGQKVYTTFSGSVIEGERLTIPAAGGYTYSTYEVLPYGVYEVIKPVTTRIIRLYGYKVSDASLKPLAYYEPDETIPVYRHSLISELSSSGSGSCESTQVTIEAKKRFIPAINDDSILVIQHTDAIRLGCQAVASEENNLQEQALGYWALATNALNSQLRHHRGAGQVDPIRMVGDGSYGGSVMNLI